MQVHMGIEHGAYRADDPDTSVAAAESINATRLEAMVWSVVRESMPRGVTAHEAADILGLGYWSISPRFGPLRDKGFIVDSGERRKGQSGRGQIVWKIKPAEDTTSAAAKQWIDENYPNE